MVKVVYCSAYVGDTGKRARHETYVKALEAVGVQCVMGHYVGEPMQCRNCNHQWLKSTEKETDINLALSIYDDAHRDVFNHAYLVTADSDQAATARMLRSRFAGKTLTVVSPPGRRHSQHILSQAHAKITLTEDHLDRAVFPSIVAGDGKPTAVRPREYAPPADWVHPDERPGKAAPRAPRSS